MIRKASKGSSNAALTSMLERMLRDGMTISEIRRKTGAHWATISKVKKGLEANEDSQH